MCFKINIMGSNNSKDSFDSSFDSISEASKAETHAETHADASGSYATPATDASYTKNIDNNIDIDIDIEKFLKVMQIYFNNLDKSIGDQTNFCQMLSKEIFNP